MADVLGEAGRFVPHVDPVHGGVDAPVLSVLRDPGPQVLHTTVLSTDNPDPTSRVQRRLMAEVGLTPGDMCPGNAFPWTTPDGSVPTVMDVARGAAVLADVVELMTDLYVVLLQGEHARWAWAMLTSFRPDLAGPGLTVVATCHPLGTRHKDPAQAARRKAEQLAAWQRAADGASRARGLMRPGRCERGRRWGQRARTAQWTPTPSSPH